jgi:hypothetical protein
MIFRRFPGEREGDKHFEAEVDDQDLDSGKSKRDRDDDVKKVGEDLGKDVGKGILDTIEADLMSASSCKSVDI